MDRVATTVVERALDGDEAALTDEVEVVDDLESELLVADRVDEDVEDGGGQRTLRCVDVFAKELVDGHVDWSAM